jgi:hypothetical protein
MLWHVIHLVNFKMSAFTAKKPVQNLARLLRKVLPVGKGVVGAPA